MVAHIKFWMCALHKVFYLDLLTEHILSLDFGRSSAMESITSNFLVENYCKFGPFYKQMK